MKVGQKWYSKDNPSSWFVVRIRTKYGFDGVWEDGSVGVVTHKHLSQRWRDSMWCPQEIFDLINAYYETR